MYVPKLLPLVSRCEECFCSLNYVEGGLLERHSAEDLLSECDVLWLHCVDGEFGEFGTSLECVLSDAEHADRQCDVGEREASGEGAVGNGCQSDRECLVRNESASGERRFSYRRDEISDLERLECPASFECRRSDGLGILRQLDAGEQRASVESRVADFRQSLEVVELVERGDFLSFEHGSDGCDLCCFTKTEFSVAIGIPVFDTKFLDGGIRNRHLLLSVVVGLATDDRILVLVVSIAAASDSLGTWVEA